MLLPKLRHILGVFGFFRKTVCQKKKPYAGQITFWSYNEKSTFFTFLNIDRNSSNIKFKYKYGHSLFKSAFNINFWLWEVVKQKIHKYFSMPNRLSRPRAFGIVILTFTYFPNLSSLSLIFFLLCLLFHTKQAVLIASFVPIWITSLTFQ